MTPSGWLVPAQADGTASLFHSSGFYIGGFDSKDQALFWLRCFILDQQAQRWNEERRAERARVRILAAMSAQGKVS